MKVNSINYNQINNNKKRVSFKGYTSEPGMYAFRSQFTSAQQAEKFVNAVRAANRQDAASSNFITAFANKIALAGEMLGFNNLKKAGEIMKTPQHRELVRNVDRSEDAMLHATGYQPSKALNLVA